MLVGVRTWAKRLAVAARPLVVLIAVLVALGPAAPLFARFIAPHAHVCHCETSNHGHATCECPICFPELRERQANDGNVALKGVCGDDDPMWRSFATPAVTTPVAFVVLPAPERSLAVVPPPELQPRSNDPPDPKPPRV